MKRKTILITSVGSQVGEGILRSIGNRRDVLRIVGVNSIAENPVNFQCDVTYLIPALNDKKAFKQKLAEIISLEKPALIIPGRDDDVIQLSQLGKTDKELYKLLITGSNDLCKVIRNKLDIYQYAQVNNLPFVFTLDTSNEDIENKAKLLIENHGWPVLIKPKEGQGSEDIWILSDWLTLKSWFGKKDYVLQPYLSATSSLDNWLNTFQSGIPLHSSAPDTTQDVVQVILGPDSAIIGIFGMHTDMRTGRSWRVIPNQDKQLLALGECFAHVLGRDGWRGPLNIQTKYHNGEYIPFEINGRFNGTTSARTELGFDEIRLCIQAFLQLDLGSRKKQSAYYVHRRSNDYDLSREALSELESQGVWHSPV